MKRYFRRKILIYALTFLIAVTVDWMIPRFMPGNPILNLLSRSGATHAESTQVMYTYLTKAFGLDLPVWKQYLNFWVALFHGDFGISIYLFPKPVAKVIAEALPYDIGLLIPAILLSWIAGNAFGAVAARTKRLDNTILPIGYIISATPYMWLGIVLSWAFAIVLKIFPYSGAYSYSLVPTWSWLFIWDVLKHWFLPFASLFIVMFGGWAIGMRNMIIYELEADYAHYLQALGAPKRMVRNYAFRNALLPQLSGLALQLGTIVAGAMATEIVFAYPGIGYLILMAIQNQDYFLLQGCFFFIIVGVLLANFLIDIIFIIVDPRTRKGMTGGAA
ncbi:MAG: ABC transporter permease [Anaerolineaceae bacterium]|jgi:peptide/nickel transport system permease protein|nr:ABC transporter permease [Anaerolineaceae bacterium]